MMDFSGGPILSETQAHRLRVALQVAQAGGTRSQAAAQANMSRQGLVGFFWRNLGSGHWPPSTEAIERLLRLPIVPDKLARQMRSNASIPTESTTTLNNRRAIMQRQQGDPYLGIDQIERKRRASADRHRQREQQWLDAERARYGLTRQTRVGALSGMKA